MEEYPGLYEKTRIEAKKQSELAVAIETIDDIEDRWERISNADGYSMHDIRRDVLLGDLVMLLKCCVLFVNKIVELEAVVKRQAPKVKPRRPKKIEIPKE